MTVSVQEIKGSFRDDLTYLLVFHLYGRLLGASLKVLHIKNTAKSGPESPTQA